LSNGPHKWKKKGERKDANGKKTQETGLGDMHTQGNKPGKGGLGTGKGPQTFQIERGITAAVEGEGIERVKKRTQKVWGEKGKACPYQGGQRPKYGGGRT